ncbi:hypothetical protein EG339_02820 [Chryseobacterium bernardetii]|uniref:Lipoprotein n=1 Tax=Chryseobacterium bernardetii TaxID=1241978 RepID=A0A3G6T374_9FLAO|nr:hypothetical protein [Chryseobacterium bernardetii]AZB23628.1 hypothetical protein EG339_02820 [Chryseobacterium bernardetii]
MKKTFLFSVALFSLLSLTSCWEWSRQQDIKDAEAKGIATLKESESSKKAMVETAKAENESATLKAEAMVKIAKAQANAEIERAKGVAEANKIIGNSLQGNEDYLKYLQIEAIKESKGSKVYIPTEAGLPILEVK